MKSTSVSASEPHAAVGRNGDGSEAMAGKDARSGVVCPPKISAMSAIRFEFEARVTAGSRSVLGRVTDIDESGLVLTLPVEVQPGEVIEIEMADSVVYGQVVGTLPRNSGFRSTIEVRRVALGKTELSRILQRVLLESMPQTSGLESPEPEFD